MRIRSWGVLFLMGRKWIREEFWQGGVDVTGVTIRNWGLFIWLFLSHCALFFASFYRVFIMASNQSRFSWQKNVQNPVSCVAGCGSWVSRGLCFNACMHHTFIQCYGPLDVTSFLLAFFALWYRSGGVWWHHHCRLFWYNFYAALETANSSRLGISLVNVGNTTRLFRND